MTDTVTPDLIRDDSITQVKSWSCGQCRHRKTYPQPVPEEQARADVVSHHEVRHPVREFTPTAEQLAGDAYLRATGRRS